MAKKNLPQGIINRLFGEYSEKRLVVVQTYDEFLAREDVRMMLTYASLRIAEGDSLALRLWWGNHRERGIAGAIQHPLCFCAARAV